MSTSAHDRLKYTPAIMAFPMLILEANKLVSWIWYPHSIIFSQKLKHAVLSKNILAKGEALISCMVEGSNIMWHPPLSILFSLSIISISEKMKP